MAPNKLTRKEIKQDKIRIWLTLISRWAVAYRVVLLSVFGLLIAALLGSYFWSRHQTGQTHELQAQFALALETFHAAVLEETPSAEGEEGQSPVEEAADSLEITPGIQPEFQTRRERDEAALEAFQRLAEQSPRTRLGQFSLYYVALSQERLGKPDQARENLERLLTRSDSPEVRNLARNSLAQLSLSAGDLERAMQLWDEILNESSPAFPKQTILMRLARGYEEKGDLEEALKRYKQLTSEYPTSEHAREAQTEIDRLEALRESGA